MRFFFFDKIQPLLESKLDLGFLAADDVGISGVGDEQRGNTEMLAAFSTQVHVVSGVNPLIILPKTIVTSRGVVHGRRAIGILATKTPLTF